MKFKRYLTESQKGVHSKTVKSVLKRAEKDPKSYLGGGEFDSMDELEDELGGRRGLLGSIEYTVKEIANRFNIDPEKVAQDYIAGKINLNPTDENDRKLKKFYR